MDELFKIYTNLRKKDKNVIKSIPLDNRIILSKIKTNSNADSELKYAWVNRAIAQVSGNKTSAILGLLESDPKEQAIARRLTLKYREKEKYPIPIEIKNQKDLEIFLNKLDKNHIIIKQNYPNYNNEEFLNLKHLNFIDKKIIYANSEKSNIIIGSNDSLQKIYTKDKIWLKNNIESYLIYFFLKNNIKIFGGILEESTSIMMKLINSILIQSEFYKGDISNLRKRLIDLVKNNILPVFKFNDSISGYGVHYPRKIDGEYNKEEIEEVIKNDICLKNYLISSFDRKGSDNKFNNIVKKIEENGIILQKYIEGNDYAIGFFKPNEIYSQNFSLEILDLDISEVLTIGTSHYGDILHYENEFLSLILKNTIFEKREELLFFSVEVLLFLIAINEGIIKKPEEFINIKMEDFGIQFMVNNKTGEIGIIEINARTPSHNFNHFNLLSIYGDGFWNSNLLYSKKILCKSAKIISIEKFNEVINNEDKENKFIIYIINRINIYSARFHLISFQIIENFIGIYYYYFIEKDILINDDTNKFEIYIKKIIIEFKNQIING